MPACFDKTRLVLFMGAAGSGKSTLARRLLGRFSMAYLNKDTFWEPLLEELDSRADYAAGREDWYDALYRIAEENLVLGVSVLLDAPHIRQVQDPDWVLRIRLLADRAGADLSCVYCFCAESTLKLRLLNRGLQRDAWKLGNWEDFLKREPITVPIPFSHVMVDTDRAPGECLETILGFFDPPGE